MEVKSLIKIARKFWQEFFFIIPVGIFLIDMFTGHPEMFKDWLGIATICFHLILFICLIGHFFWRNTALSFTLILFAGLYSMFWIFASIYMLIENSNKIIPTAILIIALFSIFPIFTMTEKNVVTK